jgi:hypothetical protein
MDRALKLALVKQELLVIVNQNVAVNQYMQRVLTATNPVIGGKGR